METALYWRRARSLSLFTSLSIGLLGSLSPAWSQTSGTDETVQLLSASSAAPMDLIEEELEHVSCDGTVPGNCTSQILFVSELPSPVIYSETAPQKGDQINYTLSVLNGGPEAIDQIRIGTFPRTGLDCSEVQPLEITGDSIPESAASLGDLFAGNVVIDRLESDASVNLSFTCKVN